MTLISTLTASNSSTLAWTGLSGYSKYLLILQNIIPVSVVSTTLSMQLGTGSGPTYITSSYNWSSQRINISSSTSSGQSGVAEMSITNLSSAGGTAGLGGFIYFEGMTSGNYPSINFQTFLSPALSISTTTVGGGNQDGNTSAKTAIQIYMSIGNINTGTASLYGISS